MRRLIYWVASLCVVGAGAAAIVRAPASAQNAAPSGNAMHGKQLFALDGCYECHGYQGEGGGGDGPKLAPDPLPYAFVLHQLRSPLRAMPVYTSEVLSDHDIADIYAYLSSLPKAKAVADIPLLRCDPGSCSNVK
ncbi:MAG TPA: c-type cytochrome [Steroidobacteraceae bacterium]|jgi:ubiquinol-cytochrome c reductase cytochrome c subunit|nr:c-type cytochrome [Steroidobacteraceae bacterium]